MKVNNNNKKGSNAKKIIPAAGMLSVSAVMLASSTFAWFTMSREAEVKNIQMTASVPEDLQISLGKLTNIKTGATGNPTAAEISVKTNNYVGLSGNQGILDKGEGTSADNGGVVAPPNNSNDEAEALYWANTADISEYYRLGKIIPASSIDGEGIFFTPDASGNGTTLKAGAKFYQAASLNSADFTAANLFGWDSTANKYVANGGGDKARTTLHAITAVDAASDPWNPANVEGGTNTYDSADAWNLTNDDGYYVDIPVWIRSSAKDDTALSVDAYVTTNAGKTNNAPAEGGTLVEDELYLAARAAIIYTKTEGQSSGLDSTNLLRIRKDSFTSTDSIINYMYSTNSTGDAISAISDVNSLPTGVTYAAASEYAGTAFLSVPGRDESTTAKYGDMVKAVVRVWLEGEDPNCWNPNAGQDFNISLKFVKGAIGSTSDANANANGVLYPAEYDKGSADQAANLNVDASTVVTIKETINGVPNSELKFQFNGLTGDQAKWDMIQGSPEILDGKTYNISGNSKTATAVTGADEIAAWLKTNVLTKADAAATDYAITPTT